jgi:hypothetical protein
MMINVGKCPVCKSAITVDVDELPISFTCDCVCGKLLLYDNGMLFDFHEQINSECKEWPKDGKGTSFVDISDN